MVVKDNYFLFNTSFFLLIFPLSVEPLITGTLDEIEARGPPPCILITARINQSPKLKVRHTLCKYLEDFSFKTKVKLHEFEFNHDY